MSVMTDPRPREREKKCVQVKNRFGFPLRASCDELRDWRFDPHDSDYAACAGSAKKACDHHEPLYVTSDTQTETREVDAYHWLERELYDDPAFACVSTNAFNGLLNRFAAWAAAKEQTK